MQNPKTKVPYLLIVVSILTGFLLVLQFRSQHYASSGDEVGQFNDALVAREALIEEQILLRAEIREIRDEINDLVEMNSNPADRARLEELRDELGFNTLTGEGLVLTMYDSKNFSGENLSYETLLVHAADLRDLVQRLWAGGAEGISINGQRLSATSPITCVGNAVMINDARAVPPFEIMAVGNQDILMQELNLELRLPQIYERLLKGDIELNLQKKTEIILPSAVE